MIENTNSISRFLTLLFFCFVASFLGSWVFLASGIVNISNTPNQVTVSPATVAGEKDATKAAEKVSPSVVSVTTTLIGSGYFQTASRGAGTGVIISKDGYILTNKHVVNGATQVVVVMNDGSIHKNVKLVGTDPLNDLAFLKIIDPPKGLIPASLGDSSKVKIGQNVLAVGNALGEYKNSVTSGIISGKGRPVTATDGIANSESLENLLQTDASINPGNSGGPLVDLSGRVIGINTAIAADAQGIGFAIEINATKGLIKSVLATGKVQRAYLGVMYVMITPELTDRLKLSAKEGAYLYGENSSSIVTGGPAQKAGLKDKDIIVSVNGVKVNQNNSLALLISQYVPGEKVTLEVLSSNGQRKKLAVILEAYTRQ